MTSNDSSKLSAYIAEDISPIRGRIHNTLTLLKLLAEDVRQSCFCQHEDKGMRGRLFQFFMRLT